MALPLTKLSTKKGFKLKDSPLEVRRRSSNEAAFELSWSHTDALFNFHIGETYALPFDLSFAFIALNEIDKETFVPWTKGRDHALPKGAAWPLRSPRSSSRSSWSPPSPQERLFVVAWAC